MKSLRISPVLLGIVLGLSASFITLIAFVQANSSSGVISEGGGFTVESQRSASPDQLPLRFPSGNWPWYAQGEIHLNPEPPIPGHPTQICAEVVNDDVNSSHIALLRFGIAPLGIGVPYAPVGETVFVVPSGGRATGCVMWMNPEPGRWGIEVLLDQDSSQETLRSLRNIDLWEPLVPGEPHDLSFLVGPLGAEGRLNFSLTGHQPGWEFSLNPSEINVTNPNQVYTVTLTTTPPRGVLLGSNLPVVDVEGFLNNQTIGGFRKVDSSPVPLHVSPDPPYAEREITVNPYPPLAGEPTEVCVELRNPTPDPQDVVVNFAWANFGIGLPFTPIDGPRPVHLPPYSLVKTCIHWVPPISGHVCLQVTLEAQGYAPQRSQRNMDVNEPLQPGVADSLTFPVGNPLAQTATITLGMVPYQEGWVISLSQDVLPDVRPGEVRQVTLTVTPPAGQPLPPDDTPVVDVEAYIRWQSDWWFPQDLPPAGSPPSLPRPPLCRAGDHHQPLPTPGGRTDRDLRRAAQSDRQPPGRDGELRLGELRHRPALHPHRRAATGASAAPLGGEDVYPLGTTHLGAYLPAGHPRSTRVCAPTQPAQHGCQRAAATRRG